MLELNQLLNQHIELPKPHSTPKQNYIPSPDMRPEAIHDENLTEIERQNLMQQQLYFEQTGIQVKGRYEYNIKEVQDRKQLMDEFKFYRKKFEKSQRAKAAITGKKFDANDKIATLDLDQDMFDPQKM